MSNLSVNNNMKQNNLKATMVAVAVALVVCATSLAGCGSNEKAGQDDSTDVAGTYARIEIPAAVRALEPDGKWYADTIYDAGDKVYYFAYVEDLPRSVIYVGDSVLLESSGIELFWPEEHGSRFGVATVGRSVMVDFADSKSVEQLATLVDKPSGFTRYRKTQVADFGNLVLYSHEVDYPDRTVTHGQEITRWLTNLMLVRNAPVQRQTIWPGYIVYRYDYGNGLPYRGNASDKEALADFLTHCYFDTVKADYGSNIEDYPAELYSNLSLRAVACNDRYVTYYLYTNDYLGGAHGYYTERLISYDPIHRQEIDWQYLFKPQSVEAVMRLVEAVAERSEEYNYWNACINGGLDVYDNQGELTDEKELPDIGLSREGVVFSFQPYEIACFAAGTMHFTVPYKALEPYLTDRARWCLQ